MGIEFEDRRALPGGRIRVEGERRALGWNEDGSETERMDLEWKVKIPFVENEGNTARIEVLGGGELLSTGLAFHLCMARSAVEEMFMGTQRGADAALESLKRHPAMKAVMDSRKWSAVRIAKLNSNADKCRIAGSGGKFRPAHRVGRKAG